jgi:hypothetical protein
MAFLLEVARIIRAEWRLWLMLTGLWVALFSVGTCALTRDDDDPGQAADVSRLQPSQVEPLALVVARLPD